MKIPSHSMPLRARAALSSLAAFVFLSFSLVAFALMSCAPAAAQTPSIEVTWLWHLHQPIYWPAPSPNDNGRRYEVAFETIQAQDGGRAHPSDTLRSIFGWDDRIAAYQWRPRDTVSALSGYSLAGAQVNYSGSLMQNVVSLGEGNILGYTTNWKSPWIEALGWLTPAPTGKPRLDLVRFGAHHGLMPLLTRRTVEMELAVHAEASKLFFGENGPRSRGFFPTETCFSTRLIPALKAAGLEWSFVPNNHISRACAGFPLILGDGGENCDPPNRADQINPAQSYWWRMRISRGCSPANAAPFASLPHWAQFVDPETGRVDKIQVIPTDQALSWVEGYQSVGVDLLQPILDGPDAADGRPPLVVFSHDGDNAYAGGYDYYVRNVPNFAAALGGVNGAPVTVETYLARHPTPENDLIHVEDGGWVNADGDFGSPVFINWNYPLITREGQIDPVNGWHEKPRELAIFVAIENALRTIEETLPQTPRPREVLYPSVNSAALERGWNFYLGAIDSGNTYYGTPGDMEVRGTIGCNAAWDQIRSTLDSLEGDAAGPSISPLQRHPYNPGATNFGVQYQYQRYEAPSDFTVWTFVYDVSGVQSATLYYRVDGDGVNPLSSSQNETFAGGAEVGAWTAQAMSVRDFPKGDPYGRSQIDYYVLPYEIARHASATIRGQSNVLLDYYVEAVDVEGNSTRSDIYHVWVGDGGAAPTPTPPAPSPTPGADFPWVVDGQPEAGLTPVAQNGLRLFAAAQGRYLYVATDAESANSNDHFLIVARQPGALRSAPWAKGGQAAAWDLFLAREGGNGWNAWFNASETSLLGQAGYHSAQAAGALLEGVVDMEAAWGAIPGSVYLSAVAYTTNDGGFLISSLQAPAPAQADEHLQANEFYEFAIQPPATRMTGFLIK